MQGAVEGGVSLAFAGLSGAAFGVSRLFARR